MNAFGNTVELSAPIEHINVHIRGGYIVPKQVSEALTTEESRKTPYTLLVALDPQVCNV